MGLWLSANQLLMITFIHDFLTFVLALKGDDYHSQYDYVDICKCAEDFHKRNNGTVCYRAIFQ